MVESSQDSSNDQSVPTISQLIADQMDATGRSYRELAKASGDRVKYQTFQELRTAPPKSWPKSVETIRGMAAALDVSETAVVLGYACSLGVDVRADSMLAQRMLGHASASMTLDIYGHLFEDDLDDVAAAIDEGVNPTGAKILPMQKRSR